MKWRNADFFCTILDSPWVSLIHVVPKKSYIIVKKNEKGNRYLSGIELESMY